MVCPISQTTHHSFYVIKNIFERNANTVHKAGWQSRQESTTPLFAIYRGHFVIHIYYIALIRSGFAFVANFYSYLREKGYVEQKKWKVIDQYKFNIDSLQYWCNYIFWTDSVFVLTGVFLLNYNRPVMPVIGQNVRVIPKLFKICMQFFIEQNYCLTGDEQDHQTSFCHLSYLI